MMLPNLHMPSKILQRMLIAAGKGADPDVTPIGAWPVYVEREPGTPDEVLTLFDTEAKDDGDDVEDKTYHAGVTLRVRSRTPDVGYVKAEALAKYLNESVTNVTVTVGAQTYRVQDTNVQGWVVRLGKELPTSQRSVFNVNLFATIERLT